MKKRAFFLGLLSLIMIASSRGRAVAACDNVAHYGAITVKIPNLPTKGTYNVWTRMQVPDMSHSQYRLEVNGLTCYEVGGSSITPGQWTWVSFQDGDVKIDRLLLIKSDCVPIADGSNCQSDNPVVSSIDIAGATVVPPPSTGPVSGLIVPSQTISLAPENIAKVVYAADGRPMPTSTGFTLDTTLLNNGSHQIAIQITKTNGTVVNEATTLVVENAQSVFSPLQRWARLNQRTTVITSSVVGGIFLLIATLLIIRHIKLQKRLLNFRGF
jgi:hypothetical protein